MRRAFTLIELLTIVAIIAIMVAVAFTSVSSGQRTARLRGAARDIFATVRQARSIALVTQKPAVVSYSSKRVEGEISARVVLDSARLMAANSVEWAETIHGDKVNLMDPSGERAKKERAKKKSRNLSADDDSAASADFAGETMEEILFSPIDENILQGVAIRVDVGDASRETDEIKKSSVSAFSNVDSLIDRYSRAKEKSEKKAADAAREKGADDEDSSSTLDEIQERVSLAWEPNGRCEPHRIWIYLDGKDYDSGISIIVDRFGSARVVEGDEE